MPESVLANPYIGPTSFTENDSDRFFGRSEETRELSSLVIARRAVLLYAQSGSGKTSLLQASLIPELKRRKRVETFPISRVTGSADPSGNLYIENALSHLFPDAPAGSLPGKTFSEAFGAVLWSDPKSRRQPHLVIFDQFEEIFTYHPELIEQREAFFAQLGECLSTYPQLSLLLSMREDYLADLEEYASLLPDRMRTRMRLERLGVEGAVEAIREPAALAGLPFAAGTAEQLVDNLRRIRTGAAGAKSFALGLYVEPVQLQIVCRQLWARVTADPEHRKGEIDVEDLAAHANVDDALIQFYRDSLAKAQQAGVRERALRRWFGERLITPAGTRGLVYRGERDTEGLPNAAVDILRDCYIIRADLRGGNVWYELAHDRLVEPVREDNLAWRAGYRNPVADALEQGPDHLLTGSALTAALDFASHNPKELTREEALFLMKCQQARRQARARRRTAAGIAVAVMVALSILSAYAFLQAHRAEREGRIAQANATEAKRQEGLAHKSANDADVQRKNAEQLAVEEKKQRTAAERQKEVADAALKEALKGRLTTAVLINKESRLDLAALLSAEVSRTNEGFEARNLLLLSLQASPGLIAILSHRGGSVYGVAFSPDGKLLASATEDGTVRFWDADRHQPLGDPLKGHSGTVWSIAFSRDGKRLASAGADKTVRLWDVASRRPMGEPLNGHLGSVYGVAFSPDGKTLASASEDKTVRLWDVASGKPLGEPLKGHSRPVRSVAFKPDGTLLVSAGDDGSVLLWATHGQAIGELLKGNSVSSLAYSPDGRILAIAGQDQTVRLVEGVYPRSEPLKGHSGTISGIAFSPDGKTLATASQDRTVRLWDVASGKPLGEPLKGHAISVSGVAFSPDGKTLASSSQDQTVRLWEVAIRQPLGNPLAKGPRPVLSVAFSPEGTILACANDDGTARLWDVVSRRPLGEAMKGQTGSVNEVALSPDGRTMATAGADHTVRLWDVAKQQPLGAPLRAHTGPVTSVAFSPDGKTLASAGDDQKVLLWNVASHQMLGSIFNSSSVRGVAFSPDGKTLATAGDRGMVRFWDLATRELRGIPLKGHTDSVTDVAFSPDGRILASASLDETVRLWDVATHQPLGSPLKGHSDAVTSVAFSRDGKTLASASLDQTVRLWAVEGRVPLGEPLKGHSGGVYALAFSPNGKMLASAGEDRTVWLWDLDSGTLAGHLCRIANRNLSLAEWQHFIGLNAPYQRTCPAFPPGEGAPAK